MCTHACTQLSLQTSCSQISHLAGVFSLLWCGPLLGIFTGDPKKTWTSWGPVASPLTMWTSSLGRVRRRNSNHVDSAPLPTTTLLPAALSPGKFAGRDPDPATGTRKIKEINRTRCPEARGEDASQRSKLRRWGPSTSWSNRVHAQACPILCNPRNCSPPGSSVHGIILARTLEWVAVSSSRGSSPLRDHTHIYLLSLALAGGFFYHRAAWETNAPLSTVNSSDREGAVKTFPSPVELMLTLWCDDAVMFSPFTSLCGHHLQQTQSNFSP